MVSKSICQLACLIILTLSLQLNAVCEIKLIIPDNYPHKKKFTQVVKQELSYLSSNTNIHLRRLFHSTNSASVSVFINPITDNPLTWHKSGDRHISYTTERSLGSYRRGQSKPVVSVIYLDFHQISNKEKPESVSVITHELTHALDLAYGRMHVSDEISERRAVFMENIRRDEEGFDVKTQYRNKNGLIYTTLDYFNAKANDSIPLIVQYIFNRNDLP